jgi:hypothetical protein
LPNRAPSATLQGGCALGGEAGHVLQRVNRGDGAPQAVVAIAADVMVGILHGNLTAEGVVGGDGLPAQGVGGGHHPVQVIIVVGGDARPGTGDLDAVTGKSVGTGRALLKEFRAVSRQFGAWYSVLQSQLPGIEQPYQAIPLSGS